MRRLVVVALLGSVSCGGPERAPARQRSAPEVADSTSDDGAPASETPPAEAPDERSVLEILRGRASYYSDRLAGRRTANGDRYDPSALTAASRDLPFGTLVRVVRVDTGASVVVRINDRGPHRDRTRILDLSRAAAEALDMMRAGVIDIRAEILERP